jgi:ectoine hydroxylase-related dioxygenase (phytanoyl-CoA dioxygenase family)
LAFRLIRPGFGDGYPFSKKNWGPGKGAISIWIPILGFDSRQMIAFIPGSNNKDYEKYLPESSKFTPDEYRLKDSVPESEVYRPKLQPGQAIVFGPQTIHTEDVTKAPSTRLSLEFRIMPNFCK